MKIAYFTAEFPGQTHIFLWREYQALLRLGVDARLTSTRRPDAAIQSHGWSQAAMACTFYLFPMTLADIWTAVITLLGSSARAWAGIWAVVVRTRELGARDRFALLAHLMLAAKMVAWVRKEGIEHIHCTTCAATANIAMFCHFLTGVPYSLSLLGPRLETYGSNQANKWRHASFALFQSQKLYRETRQALGDCVPAHHTFAPVGVDTGVMRRSDEYVPWQPGTVCRLYSCGRLHPIKGHEYVIRAARLLIDSGMQVELRIGGEDIEGGRGFRRVIEDEIQRQGLSSSVTLLGAVSEDENLRQYAAAHVYVMGSLDEAAGAVAAMEAMSMEVPVVMPDAGATAELITSGVDGLLVPARSAEALADAIASLLRDPMRAIEMGRKGRVTIEERFNDRISSAAIHRFLLLTKPSS